MDPVIRYILEQSSGVMIALVLIFKIESKLDRLVTSMNDMTTNITKVFEKSVK